MPDLFPKRITQSSLQRLVATEYGGDTTVYLDAVSDAMNQRVRTDLKQARQLADRITRTVPHLKGTERAYAQRIVARYYHLSGHAADALQLYRRAQRTYRNARDGLTAARIGRAMVDALMYLGRYDDAIKTGRQAANTFRRKGLDFEWAQTLCNIGNVYHRRDDNPRALDAYDRALPMIIDAGHKAAEALIQFNRGNILANLNRLSDARSSYQAAQRVYTDLGMELAAAQAEYSLAYVTFLEGRLTQSLVEFERVEAAFKRLGDTRGIAQTHLDRLEIWQILNLHSDVLSDAPAIAREFRDLKMSYEEAKCWFFLARTQHALQDHSGSKRSITKANRLLSREGNTVWDASLELLESRLTATQGNVARARRLAERARTNFRRAGDQRRFLSTTLFLADLDLTDGQLSNCRRRVESVLKQERQLPNALTCEAWWIEARRRTATEDTKGALTAYQHAIDRTERLALGVTPDETRLYFLGDKLDVYYQAIALLVEQGQHTRALDTLERARRLRRAEHWAVTGETAKSEELARQERDLRAKLYQSFGFPTSLNRFATVDLADVRKTEDRLWQLVRRQRPYANGSTHLGPNAITQDTLERIPANRAVIAYAVHGDDVGTFVLKTSGLTYTRLSSPMSSIRDSLARLYFLLERHRIPGKLRRQFARQAQQGIANELDRLSQMLVKPIARQFEDVDNFVFVPFGLLNAVPYHALSGAHGRSLIDHHNMWIALDINQAVRSTEATFSPHLTGTVFSPGQEGSTEMDAEGRTLQEMFAGLRWVTGNEASVAQFQSALSQDCDVLHIATHAAAALDNPVLSAILLNDGPFYVFDIAGRKVRPKMVALSACQTGRPGVLPSGEIYGFAETFLTHGAKIVLSSLWSVDDRVAREFMVRFYSGIQNSSTPVQAWRDAVQQTRVMSPNPYHWAPFVLVGQPS